MGVIVILVIAVVLFIVGREVLLWYFKLNKIEEILTSIYQELKKANESSNTNGGE